eukprot:TRINITY_DN6146_c0_g1_i1.p1 TRINITY_DN6146_c0_g1~~TRINITY_DN6146_c0_g1_i1.p1  ORF type:complete len:464 (+),score=152.90 TRINITY_DN6146_c0_g1_i1:118-1392(+)
MPRAPRKAAPEGVPFRELQAAARQLGLNAQRSATQLRVAIGQSRRMRGLNARAPKRSAPVAAKAKVVKKRGKHGPPPPAPSAGGATPEMEEDEQSEGEAGLLAHPELADFLVSDAQWGPAWAFDSFHFQRDVPQIPKAEAVRGGPVPCVTLGKLFDRTPVGRDVMVRWTDYYGQVKFKTKKEARRSLMSVLEWADALPPEHEVGQRMRYIASVVSAARKNFDIANICMALAQNGLMCDVQKEVGIRAVYSGMLGTAAADAQAVSLPAQVLRVLATLRESLSDQQAAQYLATRAAGLNTHLIVPVRNSYAHLAGVPKVHDMHANYYVSKYLGTTPELLAARAPELFDEFLKLYTPARAVRAVCAALNEQPRKIPYDTAVNWFQANCPQWADAHGWLSHFVFDTDGHFTSAAIRFLLYRLGVVRRR